MASQKEKDQVAMMAQLMMLQQKLAEQETRLDESERKEKALQEELEEQKQVTFELREDIKVKDKALQQAEEKLKAYESMAGSTIDVSSRKSSVPDLQLRPCECLETGYDQCLLYPKEFCNCSSSCSFVQGYLTDRADVSIVSMRSYSGIMTPIDEAGDHGGDDKEGTSAAQMLNGAIQDLTRRRKSGVQLLQPLNLLSLSPSPPLSTSTASTSSSTSAKNPTKKSSRPSRAPSTSSKTRGAPSKPLKGAANKQ